MPMRGKLRCSFRCTLIFFVRLVKLSCFMAARIYFQIFEQNVVSFPLARLKHQIRWTSLPMAGPRLQPSPDLPAYGPDRNIKFAGPPCLWPDRNIKFAGPRCLWPDRETNLGALRRTSLPMAGPATRFGTYKVTEWREGVQPQKTWIQKRIWKPRSSRFSSPTSIVCQGLVQTGFALHPHV